RFRVNRDLLGSRPCSGEALARLRSFLSAACAKLQSRSLTSSPCVSRDKEGRVARKEPISPPDVFLGYPRPSRMSDTAVQLRKRTKGHRWRAFHLSRSEIIPG